MLQNSLPQNIAFSNPLATAAHVVLQLQSTPPKTQCHLTPLHIRNGKSPDITTRVFPPHTSSKRQANIGNISLPVAVHCPWTSVLRFPNTVNSDNKPWAYLYIYYILFKALFCGLIFVGSLFSEGLIIGGNLHFNAKWAGLGNKNSLKHEDNSLKQLKTANTNSPWALLGRAYYRKDICISDFGSLFSGGLIFGGAYYRNFTVF